MIRSLYRRLSSSNTRSSSLFAIRRPALITILALTVLAVGIFVVQAADQFFAGDGSALNTAKWGSSAAGPFTSAFTNGNVANFATVNGTGTGGSITVAGVSATENFTLTAISGTISNQSNGVVPINVSSGKTLDFSTQSFTTSATAGYNFTGPGVLALAGNTYGGGFTINSGTLVARGVNAMGGNATPGGLTINGGTITANANRDFSNKYSGITVGGNFKLGELISNVGISSSNANLTFNAGMSLGAATRTITIGANGTYTLGGVISGNPGVGLTIANASGALGKITLTGVNTYTGDTTINGGTLALSGSGSIATSPAIEIAGGAIFDVTGLTTALTLASGQALKASGMATTGTLTTNAAKGLTLASNSPLQFSAFNGSTAPLTIFGAGSVALSSGNVVTVTVSNGGTPLAAGTYTLINKGASGSVVGTAPTSLTVNGDGIAGGTTASLQITGSELVLNVTATVTPTITVTGGPLNFGDIVAGAASAEQTYTVAGSDLTADITVTAPSTDFQVSKNSGTGFGSSVTFMQSGGTVAAQSVYVRFTPQSVGGKSGDIANASTGATTKNVAVSGTGVACPSLFNVDDTLDTADANPGDGVCADIDSLCTLRAAVMEANALAATACSPLTIDFSVTGTITLTNGQLLITHPNLTISGPGASQLTVSGNNASRIFEINSTVTASISGLTITNGNGVGATASGDGGGIYSKGTLTLTACVVTGNTTTGPTIHEGGGVFNAGTQLLTLTNCTISNNTANFGGAGVISLGNLVVTGCTVANNTNTFTSDSGRGGGLETYATTTITNSTITGNHIDNGTGDNAGGIWNCCGPLTIINSTITGNSAAGNSGAPSAGGVLQDSCCGGSVTVLNSIIAGNTGTGGAVADAGGAFTSNGYNLIGDGTGATGFTGTGDQVGTTATPINALLSLLGNFGGLTQTHALLPGSPAINAGTSSGAPATDQRAKSRFGGATDIGAFESQGFVLTLSGGNNQSTIVSTNFPNPLALTIAANNTADNEPVDGGRVTFTAPGSGASCTFASNPVTISGGAAGSGTVTANGTVGSYNVTANATGADSAATFALTNTSSNTAPSFVTVATPSRQQGVPASNSTIATVTDAETSAGSLTVTVTSANPSNGVTVSNIQNSGGTITADIVADCTASNAGFTLQVSDGSLTNTTTLNVTVTANTPPTLTYNNANVFTGTTGTINPATGPNDNVGVNSIAVQSVMPSTAPGTITVNNTTGAVNVPNNVPAGTYTVTIRATDNCGGANGTTDATFTLTVGCINTLTVNNLGDDADATPGNGVCETATGNGICSLRAAIEESNNLTTCAPLTINFSVTGTINLASELPWVEHPNLTIQGPGADLLSVTRGVAAPFTIFIVTGDAVTINDLTVSNGDASGSFDIGGGIYNGGGLLTINRCYFTGNAAGKGGGVMNEGGDVFINDSTISNNSAGSEGGGVYNLGNEGSAAMTLTNCTISGNSVTGGGPATAGGLVAYASDGGTSTVSVFNCTITNNSTASSANAGGIFSGTDSDPDSEATISLKNTLLAGNGDAQALTANHGAITSQGHNLDGDGTTGFTNGVNGDLVGTIGTPVNPLLASLGSYGGTTPTHALLPGSPAINAGTSSGAPTSDQRAKSRFGTTDIGAFESQGFTLTVAGGNNQTTLINTAFANPLAVTVTANNAADNEPVNGGQVTFTPPGSGASATVAGSPATISGGTATSGTVTANGTEGSYNVAATANGATPTVNFALTNNIAPTVTHLQRGNSSPRNTATLTFNVIFSEPVTSASASNFTLVPGGGLTGASITNVVCNMAGQSCVVTVNTGTGSGTLGLNMTSSTGVTDSGGAGLSNLPFTGEVYTIDKDAPDTTITSNPANPTNNTSATFTFTGSDTGGSGVVGFECKLDSGSFTACTSGQNYSALTDGSHAFQVRAIDAVGNVDGTPASYTWTVDTVGPTVAFSSAAPNPTNVSPIPVMVTFSENVTGFMASDITAGNGTVNNFAGSGAVYTFDLVPAGQGLVTADIAAGVAQDALGNPNSAATQFSRTYDTVAPTVTVNQAAGQADPTSNSPINFTVVFNEAVTGFGNSAADVTLSGTAGATTAVVTGGPMTYNVAVSGMTANGTVIVTIPAGAAQDLASNPNAPSTSTDNTVDYILFSCPSVLTVNDLGDTSDSIPGNGVCDDGTGKCTLRAAIEEANALVSPVLCSPLTINFSVTGTINLGSALAALNHPNLTINGPGANLLEVRRNAAAAFSIFAVNAGRTVRLSGLTISNGNAVVSGGALFNNGGNVTVDACAISGNASTRDGGGMANQNGTLNVTNSTINNNTAATFAGGLLNISNGAATTTTLTNCTISGNTAPGANTGGGVDNTAQNGAATVNLVNCTVTLNTGSGNNSFGGLINLDSGAPAVLTLKNTIVAGNTGSQMGGNVALTSLGNNLSSDGTGNLTAAGDLPNTNPLLASLANNGGPTQTHLLLPGSPAIDKGGVGVTTDQRGQSRPYDFPAIPAAAGGNDSDIGAVEVQCSTITLAGLPGGSVGVAYTQNNLATGGTAPYTLSVTGGELPPGVMISGNSLSGTPTQIGTYSFTLAAQDAYGCKGSQSYTVGVTCPAIILSPTALPNASVNAAYPQTITASPALAYSFAVTSGLLPTGLTLNSNGSFSGAPTQSGTFNFRVTASLGGCSGFADYTLLVTCPAITLSPSSLPGGTLGTGYNQTIMASPAGTYFYSVTSGALPNGLTLNGATGAITGTPINPGLFTFTVSAAAGACSGSRTYTVEIICQGVSITPASLPAATAGSFYTQTINVTPAGSYTFSLAQGNLPSGLTLHPTTGVISGLPAVVGTVSFIVKVSVPNSCSTTQSYTLTTNCPPVVTLSPASLPNGAMGTAYSQTLSASPAGGNYMYIVTTGSLPAGLTLNSATGVLSGTPTANGSFTFTVTATGFGSCTGSKSYTVVIGSGGCPTITLPASLPAGSTGQFYNSSVAASPSGSYSYTFTGNLPPGVTLYGSLGVLLGYPTANGTYNFTVTATGANNCSASQSYSVVIGTGSSQATVNDFSGDRRSDFVLWRAARAQWLIVDGATNAAQTVQWGQVGDRAVTGDYDGDGIADLAGFGKDGHWRIKRSGDGETLDKVWGLGSDVPVPGDYDGDGKTDLAVWRGAESGWYIQRSSDGQTESVRWGTSLAPYLDVPVPGDYDGDGKTDIAVFRQANGHWYIRRSSDGRTMDKAWGLGSDVPVPGDYDGDGQTDIAVWRGADTNWYILRSSDNQVESISWGTSSLNDVPAPGDYDGDGKTDAAVWREMDGNWYVRLSSDGSTRTQSQGRAGDRPLATAARP